jgi:hypothetical protein
MSESVRWFPALVFVVGLAACGYPPLPELGGGVSDAPSNDSDSNTSPKACSDRPGIFFCDDFESANLDAWSDSYGNVMRQTTTVHSGTGALYAATSSPMGAGVDFELPSPIQTGSLHFRAWFYAPVMPSATKVNLFGFGGLPSSEGVIFLVDQEMFNAFSAPGPGKTITTSKMLQYNRWFCIEVHVDISASNDAVRIDLDGVQIGSSGTGFITTPNGGYALLSAGLLFVMSGDAQIYIDDVSAGTQPIGCM